MSDHQMVCPSCGWVALAADDRYCNGCGRSRGRRAAVTVGPLVSPRVADLALLALLFVVVPALLVLATR